MDKDFSKETQNTIGYKRKVAIIGCGRVGMSIAMGAALQRDPGRAGAAGRG